MADEQTLPEMTTTKKLNSRIQIKHDTETNWNKANNFYPLKGEICLYTDIKKFKVGDGETNINELPFFENTKEVELLNIDSIVTSGSNNIITSGAVYTALQNVTPATNTVNQAGIVEAPTSSNAYKAWMTDANGNPGWRSNIPNRYVKILNAGDTEVQIPFDYDNQESNLTVYYNGILMDSPANYSVNTATNTVELEGQAEAGDVITIMGLMGAVSIDFNQQEIDLYNTYQSYLSGITEEGTRQVNLVTETGEHYIDILDTYNVNDFMTETEVEGKIIDYLPRRVTVTITPATQSEFTIPTFSSIPEFYYDNIVDNLTIYHNGLLLTIGENYEIEDNKIKFKDYQAEPGDTITVMGLAGAASIDFSEVARNAINEIEQAVLEAEETIDRKIAEIQEFIDQLPDDTTTLMSKVKNNVMDAGYKITMGPSYEPSSNNDVATKGSVATQINEALSSMATSIWQKGSTAPTDTKLFWIDTNTSTGGLKYYNGSSWTHVPVAWS